MQIAIENIDRPVDVVKGYAGDRLVESALSESNEYTITYVLLLSDGTTVRDDVDILSHKPITFGEAKQIVEGKFQDTFSKEAHYET